jgi:hypothetical protein
MLRFPEPFCRRNAKNKSSGNKKKRIRANAFFFKLNIFI